MEPKLDYDYGPRVLEENEPQQLKDRVLEAARESSL